MDTNDDRTKSWTQAVSSAVLYFGSVKLDFGQRVCGLVQRIPGVLVQSSLGGGL